MKVCFKCRTAKPITEFYGHPRMTDSRLGKCKECTKADVRANRLAKLEYYRQFDKMRASLPHRVAARKEYAQTAAGKAAHRRAVQKWQDRHPERDKAAEIAGNAVRDGRLIRQPCLICGEKAEAHHPDYSAPLDVVWLCSAHHKQAHAMARAA